MVPQVGLEPTTPRLTVVASRNQVSASIGKYYHRMNSLEAFIPVGGIALFCPLCGHNVGTKMGTAAMHFGKASAVAGERLFS